jgi:hypothetical protein
MAANVRETNMGECTPNSKIPCSYLLLCSASTALLVTVKPDAEIPKNLRKNSIEPNK